MANERSHKLPSYADSIAGSLLAAREAVMAPLRPHLRAARVTEQQWRVLRVLSDAEFLDARGIAERALLHAPTVTRILKELADRRLIDRGVDRKDARRSIITITPDGAALVHDTAHHTRLLLDAYTEAFGRERIDAFTAEAKALTRVLARFQRGD